MNPPIIVTGIGRSGTSLVAGVLHHLGVCMGEELVPPDRANPTGYWEDQVVVDILRLLLRGALGTQQAVDELKRHFSQVDGRHERWGFKSPLLPTPLVVGTVLDVVRLALPRPAQLIVVYRDVLDAAASFRAAYGSDGRGVLDDRRRGLDHIEKLAGLSDTIHVTFSAALRDPQELARSLSQLLGLGASEEQLERAAAFVVPPERRGGVEIRDGRTGHVTMQGGALP